MHGTFVFTPFLQDSALHCGQEPRSSPLASYATRHYPALEAKFRHVPISNQSIFVTILSNRAATYETLPHIFRRSGHWSDLAYALLYLRGKIRTMCGLLDHHHPPVWTGNGDRNASRKHRASTQRVNALPLASERSSNLAVRPALRNHHPPSVAERRCGFRRVAVRCLVQVEPAE